jgi:hypothetical protein
MGMNGSNDYDITHNAGVRRSIPARTLFGETPADVGECTADACQRSGDVQQQPEGKHLRGTVSPK